MSDTISHEEFRQYVNDFDFKSLFIDQGWDNDKTKFPPIEEGNEIFTFKAESEKHGFKIISCRSESGRIPLYPVRIKLENKIKGLQHEHIIIFCDEENGEQVWLYSHKVNDKNKITEIKYNIGQEPERLYQRASGLIFDLDEEENITISDVRIRVDSSFAGNSEKVTKKFYDAFKKQHKAFLSLIEGIDSLCDKEWYASIMLNRLMFCYFMQKRRFFNNDSHYLKNKLEEISKKSSNNNFYDFYKVFLKTLFHKGLSEPENKRTPEIQSMIGAIPYLNGGIFDVHEIEQKYNNIQIPNKAFENIFKLFDQYEWHLDTRDCATGNEICPDVLGYIFEKYINDRAQMGAYYTQEDITEYISRNSIIPFLFNAIEKKCPDVFGKNSEVSELLRNSGDTYIFEAVKKGSDLELPDYISIGLDTSKPNLLERRKRWNEPANSEFALPTEIWRETVNRLQKYKEVKSKIEQGEITSIEDFITYNLDICKFAEDVLNYTNSPKFIKCFYEELKKVTVLDPTCGSGAFLFAALNILEPLYDCCLSRIEDFIESNIELDKATRRFFEDELESLENHDNKQYYIYKSIILNNLYGVDIMKEATETAKLRLFLKLVSTATPRYHEENLGIEPLPDIDFNIRCGNTLVGFATEKEIEIGLTANLNAVQLKAEVSERIRKLSIETHKFRSMQMNPEASADDLKNSKKTLSQARKELNEILNRALFTEQPKNKDATPFHWYSEFYSIMSKEEGNGGFDVIIGNPPYVEYSKVKDYTLSNYETIKCGNLYAFVVERAYIITKKESFFSMIVPISIVSTPRHNTVRNLLNNGITYCINISGDSNPSTLFNGVKQNLTIFCYKFSSQTQIYTTNFIRFYNDYRKALLDTINYYPSINYKEYSYYKLGNKFEKQIINKVNNLLSISNMFSESKTKYKIYMKSTSGSHYKLFFDQAPYFAINGIQEVSSSFKPIFFYNELDAKAVLAIINSNLFNILWCSLSDGRNVTFKEISSMKFKMNDENTKKKLEKLSIKLMNDLNHNSQIVTYNKAKGITKYAQFKPRKSKPIIDEIDKVLAEHYGFTEEELDYIINYDIKYRMGSDLSDDEA